MTAPGARLEARRNRELPLLLASGLVALAVWRRCRAIVRTYTRRAHSRFSVVALFPVCRWFARVKQRRSEWWLSYL